MARKERQEAKPPDQGWIVTFSDCMTLLLCFFVLLLTFSSFDEIKYEEMKGGFDSFTNDSLDENKVNPKESVTKMIKPPKSQRTGSTTPNKNEPTTKPPKPQILIESDLTKDRIVFYMPSKEFFWASGTALTRQGMHALSQFSNYINKANCSVVVGESSRGQIGINRAIAIKDFLQSEFPISDKSFRIDSQCKRNRSKFQGKNIIAITFLNSQAEK